MKTAEQIADEVMDGVTTLTPKGARLLVIQAIEADRAQRLASTATHEAIEKFARDYYTGGAR